jgi:hypothetical protein
MPLAAWAAQPPWEDDGQDGDGVRSTTHIGHGAALMILWAPLPDAA